MKKLLLSLGFMVTAHLMQAQNPSFSWAKKMGNSSIQDAGNSIKIDASGNVYSTGTFSGTVDFDPGAGTTNLTSSSIGCYIQKLNSSGNLGWAKNIGGIGNSIALDGSGNVFITGWFSGTADFDPSGATANLTSVGSGDIFICKLDGSGNYVWAKNMGGSGGTAGNSIIIDGSGNVYSTGSFDGTTDFDPSGATANLTSAGSSDIFVCKLDGSGNYVWAKNMGGTDSEGGNSIIIDGSGNVCCTGSFKGTADFDPSGATANLTSAGLYDIFISKLDGSGNYVWAAGMGDVGDDIGTSLDIDASDNVFCTGYFYGTVDFDPSGSTSNLIATSSSHDVFVLQLDASGNFTWAKNIGGGSTARAQGLTLDALGNIYITGYYQGTADFDPGAGTYNLTPVGGDDIFISKLDASGNFVWAKSMGSTTKDYGWSIAIDASDNIYTTGRFESTVDFDPTAGTYNLTSAGGWDIFVHKMQACSPLIPGPGGVGTNLNTELWLDASQLGLSNGTGVATWTDRSGNSNDATQGTGGNQPLFATNQLNGLPVVDFDGTNDYITTGTISDLDTDQLTWITVGVADNNTHTGHFISSSYTGGAGGTASSNLWKTFITTNTNTYNSYTRSSTGTGGSGVIDHGYSAGYHIFTNAWDGTTDINYGYYDGTLSGTQTGVNASPNGHINVRLGANSTSSPALYLNGKIAEAIVYSKTLNVAERIIVDNYLATKYNLTMGGLDIYGYEATHSYDAAGIGQKSGEIHDAGRGNIVEMSEPTSLANDDFLMWAHDNASTNASNTDVPSGYGGTGKRMQRTWKIDKTNDVGNVNISFYLNGIAAGSSNDFELLVDNDGTFTNATRVTSGFIYDNTCEIATWTNVSLSDGDYITIGSPGGAALLRTNHSSESETADEKIKTKGLNEAVIYPNPNNGDFNLLIQNVKENTSVEIYNTVGQVVLKQSISQNQTVLNINQEPAGIYFVKIIENNKSTGFKKIIKM